MLLTVEGGGFFSSSGSGYRSGLSLLLLGRRTEEAQMRVLPWTQNQFAEREVDPTLLHLGSRRRSPASYRCSSFTCFRHISTATEGPNQPKVGPLCRSVSLPDSASASERSNDFSTGAVQRAMPPKSILKRSSTDCSALVGQAAGALGLTREQQNDVSACVERRTVHWTDKCGKELAQIREFEISDMGPFDDESGRGAERRCGCIIQ